MKFSEFERKLGKYVIYSVLFSLVVVCIGFTLIFITSFDLIGLALVLICLAILLINLGIAFTMMKLTNGTVDDINYIKKNGEDNGS